MNQICVVEGPGQIKDLSNSREVGKLMNHGHEDFNRPRGRRGDVVKCALSLHQPDTRCTERTVSEGPRVACLAVNITLTAGILSRTP